MKKVVARVRLVALMLVFGALSFSAPAQVSPACPCVINAACCQCADGSTRQVDLSTGFAPWRVTGPGGGASQLVIGASNTAWTAAAPPAAWVGPPGAPQTPGNYTYTLQYNVPQCVIPATVFITLQFAADDSATLAGTSFTAVGFSAGTIPTVTLPASFATPGAHTLTVVVNNVVGPTGLLVKATLNTRCPFQPPTGTAAPIDGTAQQ